MERPKFKEERIMFYTRAELNRELLWWECRLSNLKSGIKDYRDQKDWEVNQAIMMAKHAIQNTRALLNLNLDEYYLQGSKVVAITTIAEKRDDLKYYFT
jgi:hypothetical protein